MIREHKTILLIICDIDFLKYPMIIGNQSRDMCLQKVAKTIEKSLNRPRDFAARYGGEEFAVILPDKEPRGAMNIA